MIYLRLGTAQFLVVLCFWMAFLVAMGFVTDAGGGDNQGKHN
jgi:hypothetical protein